MVLVFPKKMLHGQLFASSLQLGGQEILLPLLAKHTKSKDVFVPWEDNAPTLASQLLEKLSFNQWIPSFSSRNPTILKERHKDTVRLGPEG